MRRSSGLSPGHRRRASSWLSTATSASGSCISASVNVRPSSSGTPIVSNNSGADADRLHADRLVAFGPAVDHELPAVAAVVAGNGGRDRRGRHTRQRAKRVDDLAVERRSRAQIVVGVAGQIAARRQQSAGDRSRGWCAASRGSSAPSGWRQPATRSRAPPARRRGRPADAGLPRPSETPRPPSFKSLTRFGRDRAKRRQQADHQRREDRGADRKQHDASIDGEVEPVRQRAGRKRTDHRVDQPLRHQAARSRRQAPPPARFPRASPTATGRGRRPSPLAPRARAAATRRAPASGWRGSRT